MCRLFYVARYRGFNRKNGSAGDGVDNQMSNEERAPGCFGCKGDDILPSYMGISIASITEPFGVDRVSGTVGWLVVC